VGEPPTTALEGSPNFRDLGGYRTDNGSIVRRGLVFRSGQLAGLTESDVNRLEDLGIRTVVDLRHDFEVELFGQDRLPPGVRRVALPIATAQMDPSTHDAMRKGNFTALPDLTAANREMIRHRTGPLGRLLKIISRSENLPLVFHCIGGKDRTGVASAILLELLGVPRPTIRQDYLISNELLGSTVEDRLSYLAQVIGGDSDIRPREEDLEAARRFFVLEPRYIDAALDEIDEVAGSVEQYVKRQLGLDEAEVERIRSLLLESF
jgi:protein-tyrosine phosphatase